MASLQPSVGKETRWLECSKCLVFFFFLKNARSKVCWTRFASKVESLLPPGHVL
jgi:hypothetical protein